MSPHTLPLSRLSLRFRSPEREAAYRRAQLDGSLWLLRWALGLGVLVQLAFLRVDSLVLGEQAATLWAARFGVSIPVGVVAFVLSFHPGFAAIDQPVAAAVVLVNGLTTALANLLFDAGATMYFVPGTVVVAMYGYVLLGLRFAWAAPLVGGIGVLNLLTLWALDTPAVLMAKAVYMLVISTGILTVGAYRMELTSRMEHYTAEKLLARERHARETEAARIDWLENLAHFLRHELCNSVTGVRTSLHLLERHTPPDERNGVYSGSGSAAAACRSGSRCRFRGRWPGRRGTVPRRLHRARPSRSRPRLPQPGRGLQPRPVRLGTYEKRWAERRE
ncbi:hypothetical protein [Thiocapsa marina]|uniref:Signal transduction histidine kinase dimerisation/phosphoacceptor domain-containing protein n=1 Tax=Thiocapsa marina 5811 TaxID=768671 RepID=F9UBF0_9GAMM|nr:hypothetical protein [Thiocapsa marina]EGV18268.1 hypothetical protein ThimaDRAFT_2252 [Thiocapsa marina 5811]